MEKGSAMGINTQDISAYFDPLPVPALMVHPDGDGGWRVTYRNDAAAALAAGREEELLAALTPALAAGEERWRGQLWGITLAAKMGSYPQGQTLILIRDLTEDLRRQQEQIDASQAALRGALEAANAAKTDFLSSMSHDIRTPLSAIIGMTTIAQTHLDERERVADCLEKISLSSRHLLAIINDILDMSRIESGKMSISHESFTMADFIHSLMAVARPQADKKRQRIELDFTGVRCERVRGDELRLQQVLVNILSNAVKFTPEEGVISLRVRETGKTASARSYAYYEFTVQDTGIGMSPEFLDKIFLPFERDKSASRIEGTGLGMAITHNLVRMMNGEITVSSQEGKGTCFTVTLPLEQEKEPQTELEALRGQRVLAADMDSASLRNLRQILEDLGMVCDSVDAGWKAIETASQAHLAGQDYMAILLDWQLPVVDGVQTCREMRQILGGNVPILLMSTYEWTLSSDEMRKYGVTAFMPKPLFRSRLLEALYAYTPEGKAARARAEQEERDSFEGFHILLVEDNEINREINTELITMLGASVECAEDGKAALELFRDTPPGRFDLIFMDIQMPVMNGYEATRAIRALPRPDSRTVPIIAMSANAFVEDIQACSRAGMNAHVPKPVNLTDLANVMKQFLRQDGGVAVPGEGGAGA